MKRSRKNEKRKNVIIFVVVFVLVFSMAIALIYIDYQQSKAGATTTPTVNGSNDPDNSKTPSSDKTPSGNAQTEKPQSMEPTSTPEIIKPATNAPVYIGVSSQFDVEAKNIDYIATLIKEKLMKKNYFKAESGELNSVTEYVKAFEINSFDTYIQIKIRTSAKTTDAEDLFKEFLSLVYEQGAYKYAPPAGASPTPTPTPNDKDDPYAYLTINIFEM